MRTTGLFFILLALCAYLNVFKVSDTTYDEGEMQAICNKQGIWITHLQRKERDNGGRLLIVSCLAC